ncbi:MAG: APC family permease [Sulfolobaceae archaeon]
MKNHPHNNFRSNSKKLSLRELFFIALGGQSPFISLISFGTFAIIIAGRFAVVSTIIAMILVLLNATVIYFLAKRITRVGGYYSYAFFGLSERMGFQAGWSYALFGISYGTSLMTGGAYIFHLLTGINEFLTAIIVLLIALLLLLLGVNISAKYAEIVSFGELIVIFILAIFFIITSGYNFYNPFIENIDNDKLLYSILFGISLVSGYEALNPLSQETKEARKAVGLASILAVLVSSIVIAIFFYSLGSIYFTGNLTQFLLERFGIIGAIGVSTVAISDAVLGCLVFMIAVSRVIYAMAMDKFIPEFFSKNWRNKPIFAELLSYASFALVILPLTYALGLYNTLEITGSLSGLSNFIIHLEANFALLRISLRRIKKRIPELLTSLSATLLSTYFLIYSIPILANIVVYIFFTWIIFGFLYLEALDIIKDTEEE